jgi:hypothetical protein
MTKADWINFSIAVIALVAVLTSIGIALSQTRLSLRTLSIDNVHRLNDEWRGVEMMRNRALAARHALEGRDSSDSIVTVLTFMEWTGYLVAKHAVTSEGIWENLSDTLLPYWSGLLYFVQKDRNPSRGGDPTYWERAEQLNRELLKVEARRRRQPLAKPFPPEAEVNRFLETEIGRGNGIEEADQAKPSWRVSPGVSRPPNTPPPPGRR